MSVLPKEYDRYIRFFKFIVKYWNSDIFYEESDEGGEMDFQNYEHSPQELVEDLKKMGSTYIKLGQLLSTRPDMLPEPYLDALSSLQDDVESVPYEVVEQIFKEE